MKKHYNLRIIIGLVFVWTCSLVVISCREENATQPAEPAVEHQNYIKGVSVEPEDSREFWASADGETFRVNIPVEGDFHLLFTTNSGASSLDVRVTDSSLLTVELLSGHTIHEVVLQKGILHAPDSPATIQAVQVLTTAQFERDANFDELPLIQHGSSVRSQPTPTAVPTPDVTEMAPTPTPVSVSSNDETYGRATIVAVGDSITYGCSAGCPSYPGGYPTMLKNMLQNAGHTIVMVNQGVPGERSENTDIRFSSVISGANIVLLMIGTNDIAVPSMCSGGQCRTAEHIESMINKALSAGVIPIVSTIIPAKTTGTYKQTYTVYGLDREAYETYGSKNPNISMLNDQIRALVARKGVRLVDNHYAFRANGGDALLADSLHPTQQGYNLMAQQWYAKVEPIVAATPVNTPTPTPTPTPNCNPHQSP